jgi:putative copper resistance protein D
MPSFDLSDSGGVGLVLLRGLVDVAVFGTAALRAVVTPHGLRLLPPAEGAAWARRLRRLNQSLAVCAILLLALWLVFIARSLADATDWADTESAIGTVLLGTSFGKVAIAEAAVLAVLAVALFIGNLFGDGLALLAAAAIVALQACHGHAFSMGSAGLYVSTTLHLLAAGAWLGGLPAMLWLVLRLPAAAGGALARAFSPLGQVAVLLLGVTALMQGLVMIQTWQNLFTTAYGWTALLKILLFLALLLIAVVNRFLWTPRLAHEAQAIAARRGLAITLAVETLAGLAVLLAAGLLASLPPVMAM